MPEETYCRLCAMKTEKYVNIYGGEGEKLNLAAKIMQCLQIWLCPEDALPNTICEDCCSKVNGFFDFFENCSQSQITLMAIFKENNDQESVKNGGLTVIGRIEELNHENELDHTFANDDDDRVSEQSLGYVDLEVSGKDMNKSKSYTSIKRSLSPEQIEDKTMATPHETQSRCSQDLGKHDRRCKRSTIISKDNDNTYDEERECDNVPKPSSRVSEGFIWKCTDCSEELKTLAELRKHHWEKHNQAPVFACMFCSKSYTRYRSFARHVKLHNDPKKFCCEVCGKCFSQKTVLQSHATVHSEERPHSCAQCGKSFKQFSSLYIHSKCHLPEQAKPKYPCSQCTKQFSTKHTLETHLKFHSGERNFVCDVCGKRFVAKGSLDYHMLTHNDTKPHTCTTCNKAFKTARLLMKHSSLHTGVKPHQCHVCGKQFRERGALKEHNRIHTGAMPYSCEFCGKLFRFKGILTVHRRQHTGERPYSCSECHRAFTNWANYNKHMKRRHCGTEHNLRPDSIAESPNTVVPALGPTPTLIAPLPYEPTESPFKDVDNNINMYRMPNYISYYNPPLQHSLSQTRSQ